MDGMMVFALVVAAIFVAVLIPICNSQNQSPWWSLLGILGLIGFGVAMVVLFAWKPRKAEVSPSLRAMYARGEITEEEYRLAMTGKDRAA
ncbi:MAG: SHOCT domain-containing protein [Dehalococcoidia bacterium]